MHFFYFNCRVSVRLVNEKFEKMKKEKTDEKKSLLEIYLSNPSLDKKDVVGMACDMLLAGIDTVASEFFHQTQIQIFKKTFIKKKI